MCVFSYQTAEAAEKTEFYLMLFMFKVSIILVKVSDHKGVGISRTSCSD